MGNKFCVSLKSKSRDSISLSMASGKFSAEIIEAADKHTSTLIFLHGLGDTGSGWAMNLKHFVPKNCKVICPHASSKPVTLNNGAFMPSWFDIIGLTPDSPQDEAGIKQASKELNSIVSREIASGIPANKIAIGGFSQGGALALFNALTGPVTRYACVVALSTWLPLYSSFRNDASILTIDKATPIMQYHGQMDPLVPLQMGQVTNNFLKLLGLTDVQFKSYKFLDHASSEEEMQDISKYLKNILTD